MIYNINKKLEVSEIEKLKKNPKIKSRIKWIQKYGVQGDKNIQLNEDEIFYLAYERFLRKEEHDQIKSCFDLLEKNPCLKTYRVVCERLKISHKRVQYLKYKGYDPIQIIKYIWFFYDKEDECGYKTISRKKWDEVIHKKLDRSDIYNKIVYYRCGNKEIMNDIFEQEKPYINGIINKTIRKYQLQIGYQEKEELFSEASFILMKTINKIVLNNIAQIIQYLYVCLTKNLMAYVEKNYQKHLEFREEYLY